MPQPKKLTLEKALTVTLEPLARYGDLICVQLDARIGNQPDFPNSEMRSIFAGGYDWQKKRILMEFPQPDTEIFLRELYSNGGRIESIKKFTDEELALHYDYKAGVITASGFAGNAGDPSQFVADCKEALAIQYPNNQPRETAEIVRKTVLRDHKRYKLNANHGVKHRKSQSQSASASRKLDDTKINAIVKRYTYMVENGEKYGAIKALAAEHDVTRNTIDTVLKKHNAK